MLLHQVAPLVTLNRENLQNNAEKNVLIEALKEQHRESLSIIGSCRDDIERLKGLKEMFRNHETKVATQVAEQSALHKTKDESMAMLNRRNDEIERKIMEMRSYVSQRDVKMSKVVQLLDLTREELAKTHAQLNRKIHQELSKRDDAYASSGRQMRAVEAQVDGLRQHLDNLSTKVTRCQMY